jgi:hypothetical protein
VSLAWRIPTFIKGFLQKGNPHHNILQFILDSRHPWLDANKEWLYRYPDVRREVCSKDCRLWTLPAAGGLSLPGDLFESLKIDSDNWSDVDDGLREVNLCAAALEDVRYMHMHIYQSGYRASICAVNDIPPPELPDLLDVLSKMPNLTKLDWKMSDVATRAIEPAFARRNLTFPNLKYLKPDPWSEYLVPRCPNLETW